MQGSRSDSSSEMIFRGIRFVLFGFDSTSKAQYRSELVRRGGIDVGRYDSNCTHVIVSGLVYDDPVCVVAREDGKVLVTELWIDDSVDSGALADASRVLYSPVKDLNGIPGSESFFICLTGYQKQDRDDIMKMVSLMGARFSKPLIANKVTHLICYKFEGEKYELAKKVKIKLVNHRWLEDCLKAWEILPIDNYKKSGWELEILEAEAMDTEEETEDPGTELLAQRNNKGTPSVQGNTFTASSSHLHTNKEISMIHNGVSNANMQSSKEKSSTNKNSDPTPCNDAVPSDIYPKQSLDISPKITTCDLDMSKVRESSNQTIIDLKGKGNILSSNMGSVSGNQDKRYSTLSYSRKSLKGVTKELQSSSMVDSKDNTTNGHQEIPAAELETNNSPIQTKRKISDSAVGSKSPKLFSKQSPTANISLVEPASLMPNSHVETNNQIEGPVETNSRDKQYAALSKFSLGHRKFLKRGQTTETKNSSCLDLPSIQSEHMAQSMEPMQLDNKLPTSETRSTPEIAEKALHDHEDLEKAGGSQNKGIDHCKEKAKETFNAVDEPDLNGKSENNVDLIINGISKSISDGLTEQENVSKSTSPNGKDSEIGKLLSGLNNELPTIHADRLVSAGNIEPQFMTESAPTNDKTTEIINVSKNRLGVRSKKVVSRRNLNISKSKTSKNTSSTDNAKISDEADTSTIPTEEDVPDKTTGPQFIKPLDVCTEKVTSRRKLSKSKLSTNTSLVENANISDEAATTNVHIEKVVSDINTEPLSISTDTGTRSSTKQSNICTKKTISKRKLSSKSKLSTNNSITDNANVSDEATTTNVHSKKVVSDISPEPQSISTSTSLNSKGTGTRSSTKPSNVSIKKFAKRNLSSKSKLSTNTSITDNVNISDEATTSTSVKVNTGKPEKPEKRKAGAMSKKPAGKGNKQVAEDAIVEDKLEPKENKAKKKLFKQTDASVDPEKENKPKENGNMSSHVDSHPNSKTPKQKGKGSILSKNNGQKAISRARFLEPDPVWFLLSGHRFQRKEFQRIVKGLKGRLCRDSHNWNYQATHFIVPDKVRRTEKFFAAAAAGRWILKADYLTASNEAGKFLPEEPYEWYSKGLAEDCAISLEAPRMWRQLRERTGHGAFYKMQIVIYGECITPSLETLKRAVKAGDGTILATSPPYTRFLNDRIDYAIISPGMLRVDKWVQEFMAHEIPCVAADYIVEYVCKPGHSLDRHVLFNTQSWAEKSFAYLQSMQEEAVIEGDSDDVSCSVCGLCDRGEVMLLCNDCGAGMHIDCCDPALKAVPEGDWFCPKCRKEETPKSESKSRKKKKGSSKRK